MAQCPTTSPIALHTRLARNSNGLLESHSSVHSIELLTAQNGLSRTSLPLFGPTKLQQLAELFFLQLSENRVNCKIELLIKYLIAIQSLSKMSLNYTLLAFRVNLTN